MKLAENFLIGKHCIGMFLKQLLQLSSKLLLREAFLTSLSLAITF